MTVQLAEFSYLGSYASGGFTLLQTAVDRAYTDIVSQDATQGDYLVRTFVNYTHFILIL